MGVFLKSRIGYYVLKITKKKAKRKFRASSGGFGTRYGWEDFEMFSCVCSPEYSPLLVIVEVLQPGGPFERGQSDKKGEITSYKNYSGKKKKKKNAA